MVADGSQIQEFLGVLRRRRWQVFLPALYVFVLGSAFAAIVPKKYVVTATFEVKETRNPLDSQLKNVQDTAVAREVANLEQRPGRFMVEGPGKSVFQERAPDPAANRSVQSTYACQSA